MIGDILFWWFILALLGGFEYAYQVDEENTRRVEECGADYEDAFKPHVLAGVFILGPLTGSVAILKWIWRGLVLWVPVGIQGLLWAVTFVPAGIGLAVAQMFKRH